MNGMHHLIKQTKFDSYNATHYLDLPFLIHNEAQKLQVNDMNVMQCRNARTFIENVTLANGNKTLLSSQKAPLISKSNKIGIIGISIVKNIKNDSFSSHTRYLEEARNLFARNNVRSNSLNAR